MPLLHARARRGFTLVELLVAVVLVDAGLLAITGATAVVVRRQTELRTRGAAVAAASNRLEQLATTPCERRAGSASSPLFVERWSEDAPFPGARELRDSVTYVAFGAEHAIVLATRLVC